jgi:hypothetical protein
VQLGEDGFSVHSSAVPLVLLELSLEQAEMETVSAKAQRARIKGNFFFMLSIIDFFVWLDRFCAL